MADREIRDLERLAQSGDASAKLELTKKRHRSGLALDLVSGAMYIDELESQAQSQVNAIRASIKNTLGTSLSSSVNDLFDRFPITEIFMQVYSRLPANDRYLIEDVTAAGGGAFFGFAQVFSSEAPACTEHPREWLAPHFDINLTKYDRPTSTGEFDSQLQESLDFEIQKLMGAFNQLGMYLLLKSHLRSPKTRRVHSQAMGGLLFHRDLVVISGISTNPHDYELDYRSLDA